jgi:hypothetical protein
MMIGKIGKKKSAPKFIVSGEDLSEDVRVLETSVIKSEEYFASECPTFLTTELEMITHKGRISKKLFEKIIIPKLNKLETALQLLRELDIDLEFTAREMPVRIYKDSETHLQIKEILKEVDIG